MATTNRYGIIASSVYRGSSAFTSLSADSNAQRRYLLPPITTAHFFRQIGANRFKGPGLLFLHPRAPLRLRVARSDRYVSEAPRFAKANRQPLAPSLAHRTPTPTTKHDWVTIPGNSTVFQQRVPPLKGTAEQVETEGSPFRGDPSAAGPIKPTIVGNGAACMRTATHPGSHRILPTEAARYNGGNGFSSHSRLGKSVKNKVPRCIAMNLHSPTPVA
jgi:hypothetical protein